MANTKDRLDELERGMGLVTDDLHKLRAELTDKLRLMEEANTEKYQRIEDSNRTTEGTLRRLIETVENLHRGPPPVLQGHQPAAPQLPGGGDEKKQQARSRHHWLDSGMNNCKNNGDRSLHAHHHREAQPNNHR
ncbi:unnamed protein product [Arabis nemorensis]|uniref:Uncharacterized protein n=1 Tax=Arabis nemorensis TaxID=586526 RepID=A0A565AS40_9BRAS|nr:unnamed protein product [Arabis nemorensis]